jgi:lysophospholipase L1-like esterase
LGDSLSAGKDLSSKERCWPAVLGDMTQLTVVNLAQPGARLRNAMEQVKRVTQTNAPIILEIGANDTLEEGPHVAKFREQLDALVDSLHDHRPILMFEIPLFPLQNAYGQAQREVAAKYGVMLIPKRCLMSVWRLKGSTLDGIHFSQTGHNAIAHMIADVLSIEDAAPPDGDADSASKPATFHRREDETGQ